jgi:hypothetical protein
MGFYKSRPDKQSGDGLAITDWNDLSNAVAGNSGLTLALSEADKVGIGTKDPGQKLEVTGGNAVVNNVFIGDVGHGENWAGFSHRDAIGANSYGLMLHNAGTWTLLNKKSGGGLISFRVDNADKMVINDSGNVGIGTASPTAKLEVSGDITATRFIGDGSQLTNLTVGVTGLNLATTGGSKVGIGTTTPRQKLEVAEGNAVVGGYIGIGTTSPEAPLSIETTVGKEHGPDMAMHITNDCILFGGHNNGKEINSAQISAGKHIMNSLNIIGMASDTSPRTRRIDAWAESGFVIHGIDNSFWIRTNSTQLLFTLQNSYHGGAGTNRTINWDGDNNWGLNSDIRLKTDIETEGNILARLMQLEVKNFQWKAGPEREHKMLGFIAQDVKPLFPALVGAVEDPGTNESTLTLKYANFGVLAVGAIKELKLEYDQRIVALEQEITDLREKLAAR